MELIVFDDDGATHSTVLELEILAAETEETADSLAWIGVVLLVGVLVGVGHGAKTFLERSRFQSGRFRQQPRTSENPVHHRIMMQRLKKTKREDESCSLKR